MTGTGLSEEARREIEELLPWHAAGTLSPAEAERVEAAIAADPELAEQYARALEELAGTIEQNEAVPVPSGRLMAQLMAKIDAEPQRRRALSPALRGWIVGAFERLSPRTLAWSAAAAALVIAVQAGVIAGGVLHPPAKPAYQTASAPAAPAAPGAIVLVQFKPNATMAEVDRLLQARQAAIVSGPSGGFYKVRVSAQPMAQDKLQAAADALQQDRAVAMAVPGQ